MVWGRRSRRAQRASGDRKGAAERRRAPQDRQQSQGVRQPTPLQDYVTRHFTDVPGWAGTAGSALMLDALAQMQDDSCKGLGAFEVGVYQGRFLIALHSTCAPGTRSLGIDLFDDQDKKSSAFRGVGLAEARENVRRTAREPDLVELRSGDSLRLDEAAVADIRAEYEAFRFASVDGAHTPVHVVSDTKVAAQLTAPAGFIIVDDFFNPFFPGVTEGIYRLLTTFAVPFVPLLVTSKKLYLCHLSYRTRYWRQLKSPEAKEHLGASRMKRVEIAGHAAFSIEV